MRTVVYEAKHAGLYKLLQSEAPRPTSLMFMNRPESWPSGVLCVGAQGDEEDNELGEETGAKSQEK